jgi:hypothetical protein
MKIFYGVMTEIYDDDSVKAYPIYLEGEKKPGDTLESYDGVTVYKDWYGTERMAALALAKRRETARLLA